MARLFGTLDTNLLAAAQAGRPLWKTTGEGGSCPKRPCHDFGFNALQDGARVDFKRGSPNDDLANMEWSAWLNILPLYSSCVPQGPSNLTSRGFIQSVHFKVTFRKRKCASIRSDEKYEQHFSEQKLWKGASDRRCLRLECEKSAVETQVFRSQFADTAREQEDFQNDGRVAYTADENLKHRGDSVS